MSESSSNSSPDKEVEMEKRRKIEAKMFKNQRRHYKKDTRYVLDLYTLTFDEDETVDSIGTIICKPETTFNLFAGSSQVNSAISNHYFDHSPLTKSKSQPSFDFHSMNGIESFSSSSMTATDRSESTPTPTPAVIQDIKVAATGPSSLPDLVVDLQTHSQVSPRKKKSSAASIASLETNLHKILARKFADELSTNENSEDSTRIAEEVSFKKAKLLTKAYYRLLRNLDTKNEAYPDEYTSLIDSQRHSRPQKNFKEIQDRSRWQTLISADVNDLGRMSDGLTKTVAALNEYLVEMLMERDDLLMRQDTMLEEISELADTLLHD